MSSLKEHIEKWCTMYMPTAQVTQVEVKSSPDVPMGTIRLTAETHWPTASVGSGVSTARPAVVSWNAGAREHDILGELYAAALAEPYITWAGELAWRATDAGKKAGLK